MVFPKCDKSLRVRYVLNGVPQEMNLPCDERPKGLHYEELCDFVNDGLWSALKLNRNEDTLSDIQVLGFND